MLIGDAVSYQIIRRKVIHEHVSISGEVNHAKIRRRNLFEHVRFRDSLSFIKKWHKGTILRTVAHLILPIMIAVAAHYVHDWAPELAFSLVSSLLVTLVIHHPKTLVLEYHDCKIRYAGKKHYVIAHSKFSIAIFAAVMASLLSLVFDWTQSTTAFGIILPIMISLIVAFVLPSFSREERR